MLAKTTHLELPRRVTAYYLLFGLAGIAWLTAGVVIVSHVLLSSRDESASLIKVGKAAKAVAAEYANADGSKLQDLVERQAAESGAGLCGPRIAGGGVATSPIPLPILWGSNLRNTKAQSPNGVMSKAPALSMATRRLFANTGRRSAVVAARGDAACGHARRRPVERRPPRGRVCAGGDSGSACC